MGAWNDMIRFASLTALLLCVHPLSAGLPESKQYTNSVGMKLVRIEPGEFLMGSGAQPPKSRLEWQQRDSDEAPAHKVKISRAFFLGAHEVTNAQCEQFDPH